MGTYTPTVFGDRLMLAVDPGGTTGWLLFRPVLDEEQASGRGIEPIDWGEDRNQMAFLNQTWTWLTRTHPLTGRGIDGVVCELWQQRGGSVKTWEPEHVEIQGTLRWMMADDPQRFFLQQVSHANSFGTPEKINRYRRDRQGPYNVGKGGAGHAVKALQHAVLWTHTRWAPEPGQ